MARFFRIDLATQPLTEVPDKSVDFIVMTHVIEHLSNGLTVLSELCGKLRRPGAIYVEFPSPKSLSLPSALGTLQFCDDPTHVRVYDIKEVANVLLGEGLRVTHAGKARTPTRLLLSPFILMFKAVEVIVKRRLTARGLWEISGFADYVFGVKD